MSPQAKGSTNRLPKAPRHQGTKAKAHSHTGGWGKRDNARRKLRHFLVFWSSRVLVWLCKQRVRPFRRSSRKSESVRRGLPLLPSLHLLNCTSRASGCSVRLVVLPYIFQLSQSYPSLLQLLSPSLGLSYSLQSSKQASWRSVTRARRNPEADLQTVSF